MAYKEFADNLEGQKERKAFYLSDDGLKLVTGWRRNGATLTEIATDYIGVSKTAFFGWYRENDELRKACAIALDIANLSVEEALLKRACGYDYWEETWDLIEGELRLAHKHKRHVPPDVKAILSWLYNRLPTKWRSIQEPLESTQYVETIKNIMVAMKEVANNENKVEINAD